MIPEYRSALIVGAGDGLSASVARVFAGAGMKIGLAARNIEKLTRLSDELGAVTHACDVADPGQVEALFSTMDEALGGPPDVVVYNPSARVRGMLVDLDRAAVAHALTVTAFGGFLVAQAAAKRMLPSGRGAILFTGASASIKGYPGSAPFAMGKFALRGPGAKHRPRTPAAGDPCRSLRDRRRDPESWHKRAGGQAGQHARS
jgi:NAD(P)-dependent dehydrogenase (short-subunit alcohol dehydrogenase family)